MKTGCQASINIDAKKERCLNSFREGRKYFTFFFFFQFYWKPMRSPVYKRRQECCQAARVAAEQAAEVKEKDANEFRKVEEDTVKPDSCNGSEIIITKHYY